MYGAFGGYDALFYLAAASNAVALAVAAPVLVKIRATTSVRMYGLRLSDVARVLRLRPVLWLTVDHMVYSVG